MFARTFHNDPMMSHLLPDAAKRPSLSARSYQCLLRYGIHCGEVLATSANLEGVAIWLPPEAAHGSLAKLLRACLFTLPLTAGPSFFCAFPFLSPTPGPPASGTHAVSPLVLAVAWCRSKSSTEGIRHGPCESHARPLRQGTAAVLSRHDERRQRGVLRAIWVQGGSQELGAKDADRSLADGTRGLIRQLIFWPQMPLQFESLPTPPPQIRSAMNRP